MVKLIWVGAWLSEAVEADGNVIGELDTGETGMPGDVATLGTPPPPALAEPPPPKLVLLIAET